MFVNSDQYTLKIPRSTMGTMAIKLTHGIGSYAEDS